jgi:hypothetical protein
VFARDRLVVDLDLALRHAADGERSAGPDGEPSSV